MDQPAAQDFLERMAGCLSRAHSGVLAALENEFWDASESRTKANLMHDLAMTEAKREFADDESVTYLEKSQLKSLATGFAHVRLKKANKGFTKLSFNPNRRTAQWTQLPLSKELSPLDRIFMAYSVSQNWQLLENMALMEYERGQLVDSIIIPFVDEEDDGVDVSGAPFVPPLRLNFQGIERITQAELKEIDERESNEAGG